MRICVDIDGILTNETEGFAYEKRTPNLENIQKVNALYRAGHEITLFTARWAEDREVTVLWLATNNVLYHALRLDKPIYEFFVDDRARSDFPTEEEMQNYCKRGK